MPRPRTPLLKAIATGRVQHDPKRFKNRIEPKPNGPLGAPPAWMTATEKKAWETFSTELVWLNKSHRSLIEIAAKLRAKVMVGDDLGVKGLNLLRQCLGQMGATPADASKVVMPEGDEAAADPADKYFS